MTASSSFSFQPTSIGAMLKQGHLKVPPNQRSYAWRERHVDFLLKDLWAAMSGAKPSDYFLGTIVLVQTPGNILTIVDGQQRLATVAILFARIRDYFYSLKRDGSAQSVQTTFIGLIDPRSEQTVPRLHLNDDDNDFFWNEILLPQRPVDKPLEHKTNSLRQSHARMLRASEKARTYIGDLLKPLDPDSRINVLLRWYEFLDSNAHVLSATVADEEAAYRLFETLNDRGLRASQADILKNFFFSKSGDRLGESKLMWARMASTIETPADERDDDDSDNEEGPTRGDPLLTYVRHSWILNHGHTKVKDLAKEIREEVTNDTRAI
jgi:hypothetical protein